MEKGIIDFQIANVEFIYTNLLKRFLLLSWNENKIVTSSPASQPYTQIVHIFKNTAQMFMWLVVRLFDSPLLSAHVKLIKQLTMWRFTFSFSLSTFRPPSTIMHPKRFLIILKFNRSANTKWIGHNYTPPNRTLFACNWICTPIIYPNKSTWNRNRITIRFWIVRNLYAIMALPRNHHGMVWHTK